MLIFSRIDTPVPAALSRSLLSHITVSSAYLSLELNSCLLFQSPEEVFMEIRRPLEWHCKQMDHFVGLNFSANFNFALVGHLLKGKDQRDECSQGPHVMLNMCRHINHIV